MRPGVLLMALTWVICGAGRGVGKTHLALSLCRVLPRALYAKLGHGPARPDRPENFFTRPEDLAAFVASHEEAHDHVVVEANTWALERRGDVVIYLEGAEGRTGMRQDRETLRGLADIRIDPGAAPERWESVLGRHLPDPALREEVRRRLLDQARHLSGRGPS